MRRDRATGDLLARAADHQVIRCLAPPRLGEIEVELSDLAPFVGLDEAGRGPLAGPVVAAAVLLPEDLDLPGLDDSKRLAPARREVIFERIAAGAPFGVSAVSVGRIAEINILRAALEAMVIAYRRLRRHAPRPGALLIDGTFCLPAVTEVRVQRAIVKGDRRSRQIAAASVVAKVVRDRIMAGYHRRWPEFGFDRHRGYHTPDHIAALRRLGPTPIHRMSFAPVREIAEARA